MDARMLRYYTQELSYMREMGAEFATAFPKIAARLSLDPTEVADPYVERLLRASASWRPGFASSSTPSFRASPSTCWRSCTRTT